MSDELSRAKGRLFNANLSIKNMALFMAALADEYRVIEVFPMIVDAGSDVLFDPSEHVQLEPDFYNVHITSDTSINPSFNAGANDPYFKFENIEVSHVDTLTSALSELFICDVDRIYP